MLNEIYCDHFLENPIKFHNGFNIIVGDKNATNSIGKSMTLMLVDFAHGGNSFIEYNTDVSRELGHHDYFFHYKFQKKSYFFKRGTFKPDIVFECDQKFNEIKPLSLIEYNSKLKTFYLLENQYSTFRSLIGVYQRIWGKKNLTVDLPLHSNPQQKSIDTINYLLALFGKYDEIHVLSKEFKTSNEVTSFISNAKKIELIPKTSKNLFQENEKRLNEIDIEIEHVKKELSASPVNFTDLISDEFTELKAEKDDLLEYERALDSKLKRIRGNLQKNSPIKKQHLESLKIFFPKINSTKIAEIENFHTGLSKILKSELLLAESNILNQKEKLNIALANISSKISKLAINIDNPEIIIEKIQELTREQESLKNQNNYYLGEKQAKEKETELKTKLSELKKNSLQFVENLLNNKVNSIITSVYEETRTSPTIVLKEKNYKYSIQDDTGTGKAYSNLIIFDLAVFQLTPLPILTHDSVLFKNIENSAVSNLLEQYSKIKKQSFIALDEIEKYNANAAKIIKKYAALYLKDKKQLYKKDWRSST